MSLTEADKEWIAAQIEATETRLRWAFDDWASPIELPIKSHAAALRTLDVEQEAIAARVTRIEEKSRPSRPA